MKLHNVWYLVRQGIKNVFKNGTMTFSSIGVLVACMLLIGASILLTMTVNNIVGSVERYNEIVVDLKEKAPNEDVETQLNKIGNILQIDYISKEDGLENLSKELRSKDNENENIMKGLQGSENPLPDRFVVRIENVDKMDRTIAEIEAISEVEEVRASQEVAKILSGIKKTTYYAGIVIVIILLVVSLAIITNTIKLTIFSRRREINIMKYVGATDTFIRLPYVIEGVMIGVIAALIAFIIMAIGYPALVEWANEDYGSKLKIIFDNLAVFDTVALKLLAGFSIMGVSIGLLSGTIFVSKHLKV